MIDDYEIIQEIGRGSFATVFKGKLGNGQIVAIKSVQKAKLNRKLNENLETEIAILNKSRHRNVVSLFTVTKSEKEIHLVMEFCALGDLSIFIKKRGVVPGMNQSFSWAGPWGGLDEFVVRHLLGQLASAIEFLRFHQIIHRDLKPQNILLAAPPNAGSINTSHMTITDQKACYLPILKLGDFGFARSLEFQDMASTLCGSPLYMAPEILRGEKYDAKSDLWSLGAIAYEMITGKTPFRAQNHIELIRKIERGDGWIRFPDETIDEHNTFQTREYHGGLTRPTLLQRKSIANFSTAPSNPLGVHIGSLGSSPKFLGLQKPSRLPNVPEDLKSLIRKLLKRNPMERMTFEEFFINKSVQDCRELDNRASMVASDLSNGIEKQFASTSLLESVLPVKPVKPTPIENKNQIRMNLQGLQTPFPGYSTDPNWMDKVIENVNVSTQNKSPPVLESNMSPQALDSKPKTPMLTKTNLGELSPSSFGSSIGSFEFSSDDEIKDKKGPIPKLLSANPTQKNTPSLMQSSEDYVVVEKGVVEVKWHANEDIRNGSQNDPSGDMKESPNQSFPFQTNTFHTTNNRPGSLERSVLTQPKARLFGSLRSDGFQNASPTTTTPAMPFNPLLEIPETFGPLPYTLNLDTLNVTDRNAIGKLNLTILRAMAASNITMQFLDELENLRKKNTKNLTVIESEKYGILADETLSLLIFTIGCYQYSMNRAKELWNKGPSPSPITDSYLNNTTTPRNYLSALGTIIQYTQNQFNIHLQQAENTKTLLSTNSLDSRGAERIIYETCLILSKKGGLAELNHQEYSTFYKTAILLLQSLIQPHWDQNVVGILLEDQNVIKNLLNQLSLRITR